MKIQWQIDNPMIKGDSKWCHYNRITKWQNNIDIIIQLTFDDFMKIDNNPMSQW